MRNLKRTLSLVLAALMLMGMMVVGAGAAGVDDFSDKDEIVNKDAVSMLTILGVINGKEDGSYYAPKDNVTRAEMAKMIATILNQGADVNDLYANLETGLTDIDNSWAKGYINYCYSLGIIAGRGNGTFDPTAPVTGNEAAKMLLVAIGYDPEIEGLTGASWAIKTTSLASTLGIFDDLTAPTAENLNRDNAALLIYNALDVEMIQKYEDGYAMIFEDHRTLLSNKYGVYKVQGVVVANEYAQLQGTDSDAALIAGKTTLDDVVVYSSTTSNTTVGEGVSEKEPVTFNVTTDVSYLGKAVTMYIKKTTILANSTVLGVTLDDNSNVVNSTSATQDTVKDYLKGTGVAVDNTTEYYVNYGAYDNLNAAMKWINEYSPIEAPTADFNLNGITVEVVDNDKDGVAEYVLFRQETLSEVVRYNTSNETISFYAPKRDANEQLVNEANTVSVDFEDAVMANDAYETGDLILYVQYGGRTYITNPTIVTGTMTRLDRDTNDELYITLDNGDEYRQSFILDVSSVVDVDIDRFIIGDARSDVGFTTKYDFILDSTGKYIVAFRPAEDVVTNYALVLDSAWTQNALTKSGEVKILKTDGTTTTYKVNLTASDDAFHNITAFGTSGIAAGQTDAEKLERYLGTRDVNVEDQPNTTYYRTGVAAGTIISYTLSDDDVLTIESVLQGNSFKAGSIDIDDVNNTSTAGVADNKTILSVDGDSSSNNLQYETTAAYENGKAQLNVKRSDNVGNTKTYAVDLNTVAFYYYKETAASDPVYGVATGWNNMSKVAAGVDTQVYPALEKTGTGTYKASNLIDVVLFEAEPLNDASDYMLILSPNAIKGDDIELNVVFEDGTTKVIDVDDQGDFDEDLSNHYMQAWTYTENADGTYDIGHMAPGAGTANLLIDGTVDFNNGTYYALDESSIWDVTEVFDADDTPTTGVFQKGIDVNAVIIAVNGKVRTAWIWDLDNDHPFGSGYTFNWNLNDPQSMGDMGTMTNYMLMQAFNSGKDVQFWGDLNLTGSLYIPTGRILQVEGDVNTNGYSVTGGGTLRVRNNYNTNAATINMDTQVGGNLNLTNIGNVTISSRVGVGGNITASNQTIADTLTIAAGGYVYATGDVSTAGTLRVDGHIEAEDYWANRIEVYSANTLIARGNITANVLIIGNSSNAGSVTVNGTINNAAITATNGTLSLTANANTSNLGSMYVDGKGKVLQVTGSNNLNFASGTTVTVTAGGTLDINGTLKGNAVVNVAAGASVSVGSTPDGNKTGSGQIVISGTSSDTPVVSGMALTSLKVKGVDASIVGNQVTVNLTNSQATNSEKWFTYTCNTDTTMTVVGVNGAVSADRVDPITSGTYTITLSKAGVAPVSYTLSVTVAAAQTNAKVSSITVKGQTLTNPTGTGKETDPYVYTANLTYNVAWDTSTVQLAIVAADSNATISNYNYGNTQIVANDAGVEADQTHKGYVGTGTVTFMITAEDNTTKLYYQINVTSTETGKVTLDLSDNGNEHATVYVYQNDTAVYDLATVSDKNIVLTAKADAGYGDLKVYCQLAGSGDSWMEVPVLNGQYTLTASILQQAATAGKTLIIKAVAPTAMQTLNLVNDGNKYCVLSVNGENVAAQNGVAYFKAGSTVKVQVSANVNVTFTVNGQTVSVNAVPNANGQWEYTLTPNADMTVTVH